MPAENRNPFLRTGGWALLGLFLVFITLSQLGLLVELTAHDLTLAIPYMVTRDMRLYADIFSYHPPLSTWFLAGVYRLFEPLTALRVLNVIYVLGTAGIVFWAGKRISGRAQGLAAALFYMAWTVNYNGLLFYIDGLTGTASAAILLLATCTPTGPVLAFMGLIAGAGAALKPTAILLIAAPLVWLAWNNRANRWEALRQSLTFLIPAGLVFGGQYAALVLSGVWPIASRAMFNPGNSKWLFALSNFFDGNALRTVALTCAFVPPYLLLWLRDHTKIGLLVGMLFAATFMLNIPALGYYHFMSCLPVVALMSGAVIAEAWKAGERNGIGAWPREASVAQLSLAGLVVGLGIAMLVTAWTPLFVLASGHVRTLGWDELQPVSQWLDAHTQPEDTILVLPAYDTNANVYPQAKRLPPFYMKTWSYHASVPENAQLLQSRVLAAPPAYIVLFSDLYKPVTEYFPDLNRYLQEHYHEVARIDEVPLQGAVVFLQKD
jgi:hypothetical protein